MHAQTATQRMVGCPEWVPDETRRYLAHVEHGTSIRSIAKSAGCHASTVLRQIRRTEQRRDDLLIDLALERLTGAGVSDYTETTVKGDTDIMTSCNSIDAHAMPDDGELRREAPRLLRRLNESGASLAIARDMEKAVIVREMADGQTVRTAVFDRSLAEAMALNDWIALVGEGRISRYKITGTGRMALRRLMAEDEALRIGLAEGADPYSEQHRDWARRNASDDKNKKRGIRYNAAESPLSILARRKDKDGTPFLSPDLVMAGERLREDFELAQIGPRVAQNWDRFLTGGTRGDFATAGAGGSGSDGARDRVAKALQELGPGLADVVLRTCCYLEGMEHVERHLGWSARSGKIVLRIALNRLKMYYDSCSGSWSPMIG